MGFTPTELVKNIGLQHDIDNLSGDDDDLFGGLALGVFLGLLVCQDQRLNLLGGDTQRQRHLEPHLAVERHGVLKRVLHQEVGVELGVVCIAHRAFVAQEVPELLGDVGCEGREKHCKRLQDCSFVALTKLVEANHKCRNRGVEREVFDILSNLLDGLVEGFELGGCGLLVAHGEVASLVEVLSPEAAQEFVHTVNAVGVPRFALLQRTEEHFVHTESVGAVVVHNVVGIYHIEHTLTHLLNSPTADVFAVLQDELCIVELGAPSAECIEVENVVLHDVYINVNFLSVILFAQTERYEFVGTHNAIYEVGATLNHTLIYEFFEGLVLADVAEVEEEFVPEARVDEVTCCVLNTANVEVNIAPILVCLAAYESLRIAGVHIAQVVCRRARKTRHCAGLVGVTLGGMPLPSVPMVARPRRWG